MRGGWQVEESKKQDKFCATITIRKKYDYIQFLQCISVLSIRYSYLVPFRKVIQSRLMKMHIVTSEELSTEEFMLIEFKIQVQSDTEFRLCVSYDAQIEEESIRNMLEDCLYLFENFDEENKDLFWTEELPEFLQKKKSVMKKMPLIFEEVFPLSEMQQLMVINTIQKGGYLFSNNTVFKDDSFDYISMKKAMQSVVMQNPILRTVYIKRYGCQVVKPYITAAVTFEDLQQLSKNSIVEYMKRQSVEDFDKIKKLDGNLLYYFHIYKIGAEEFNLLFVSHHSIIDGWGLNHMKNRIFYYYKLYKNEMEPIVKPLQASYKEYVEYEQMLMDDKNIKEYWQQTVKELSENKIKPLERKGNENVSWFEYCPLEILEDRKVDKKYSYKNIFLGALLQVCKRLYGVEDISIGIVSNVRPPIEDMDKVLGVFVNTVPVSFSLKHIETAEQLLDYIEEKMIELVEFSGYPLAAIQCFSGNTLLYEVSYSYTCYDKTAKNTVNVQNNGSYKPLGDYDIPVYFSVHLADEIVIGVESSQVFECQEEARRITEHFVLSLKKLLDGGKINC